MRSLLVTFALLCSACHHSSSSGPAKATDPSLATGEWRGRWVDELNQTEGNLMLVLHESAGALTGDVQMDAPSCISATPITGTCDGFDVAIDAGDPRFLAATAAFYEHGDRLIGEFELAYPLPGGVCVGRGTFDARRLGAEPAELDERGEPGEPGELVIVYRDGDVVRREITVLR